MYEFSEDARCVKKTQSKLNFFSAIRYDKVVQKHNFLDLQVGSSPNLVYHHA